MQVVEHQPGATGAAARFQNLRHGLPEARLVHRFRRCRAEFGQHARQFGTHRIAKRRDVVRALRPEQRAQQARQQRIRHALIARESTHQRHAAMPREVVEQAGLPHPGVADEHGDAATLPGLVEQAPLRLAADQHRRPRQRGRDAPRRRARQTAGTLDQLRQLARFGARRGTQLPRQALRAARVGSQRRRAIAAPVVQSHQQPVRLLGQRLVARQPLGEDQRAGDVPGRLLGGGRRRKRVAPLRAEVLARHAHPVVELEAVLVAKAAEQLAAGSRGILRELLGQRGEVVRDAGGQRQRRPLVDHVAAGGAAQAEQPLAQVVAGPLRVGVRP